MLRTVMEDDLRTFFEHQLDPVASSMAVFKSREWDDFIAHWRHTVLANPGNVTRTITLGDEVAGYVGSWEQDGKRLVAYWIGSEYWGRGVASAALAEFLTMHERHRPMHAYVALSNAGSIRVLEKCGFQRVSEPAVDSDEEIEGLFVFENAL